MDPLRNPLHHQPTYSLHEALEEFDLFERLDTAEIAETEEEEGESEDE